MFNYNIENTQLSLNKGKMDLRLKGWAFNTEKDIKIKITDDKDNTCKFKLQKCRRSDVYKYFKNNEKALESGIILEINSLKKTVNKINILFLDDKENLLLEHIVDIKKLNLSGINEKISYNNLEKVFRSIKKDGIKLTYNKIMNKFKNIETGNSEQSILEPYVYIDENYEYQSVNNHNIVLIINSTNNSIIEDYYLNTVKSVQKQNFNKIINLYTKLNNELILKNKDLINNCTNMECEEELITNDDVLKFIKKKQFDIDNVYYIMVTAGDSLAGSSIKRIEEVLDKNNAKIITFNEDRILEDAYIAPLYKEDAINQKRNKNIIFRKGLVIHSSKIENYLEDKIDISDIHVIDKVLYHYRIVENSQLKNNVKPIAFYLPQYHAIPENDEWWGKGFTEWTNVTKGKPLFDGHYQPHVPGKLGYYNLVEDKSIQYKQIELAKEYGIHGFCYYYYWFNGKRLLEKPLDNLLADKGLDFPFCICWANETWSRRWDGQEKEVLIKQEHNEDTDNRFIEDIIPILKDDRYIKVNGAPILLIYRAELFPNLAETITKWKEVCKKNGVDDLHVSLVQSFGLTDPNIYGGDSAVEFPPHGIITGEISKTMPNLVKEFGGNIYDYRDVVSRYVNKRPDYYKAFRGAMLSWDNTARRGANSNVFAYANPKEYKKWITGIVDYTNNYNDEAYQYVFINAWNEWAEGTHLEPDERYGTQYLKATKEAIDSNY
ncbi:glycosyltransferase WbsX family protein [Clostridium weizhouense]|uniref:Glycoside hydrolase family 99-like domain-containing protein n=1 Tax=Clostridium weizhouense TaxID=2859781 RepID=A0ABS7AS00_9CLOT|nr:glycoside hydrolase family 99-like domain-containing protein [Clostridium weizhouense]MBW6410265.1 glycoside hydrolase family 99-like domain-containing protein [Clostridium weizhouense]